MRVRPGMAAWAEGAHMWHDMSSHRGTFVSAASPDWMRQTRSLATQGPLISLSRWAGTKGCKRHDGI